MLSCFCGKAEKETFRVLDYSHCNLLNVPAEIYEHAPSLEELYLDANQLKDLPKALFTLQQLRVLNVNDNEIISLPSNVSNLIHLKELDVSKNGFLELPDNVKGLKSLETFDGSVNPLGKLPDGFTMLLNLTHVSLNDTFLDFLPANIGRLSQLVVLEVRENHLSSLPKSMNKLTKLERLDIGNNEFCDLPEVIGSLGMLRELWLDFNQFKCLPQEVGNLRRLEFLDASENRIEWVADELGEAESLTDLHLTTNMLLQLPENVCKLKKLQTLKVDDNHLTQLPTSIGGLSSLQELIVSGNELECLPPGIGLLRDLRILNADENFISNLPEEMGSCHALSVLSLRRNRLVCLPDEVGRLASLTVLNVSSNLLEHLPYSMMKLKNLKALWLSENQAKPLIPLQNDFDEATQRRFLTCYMFPQQPPSEIEEGSTNQDEASYYASLFEEECKKRTSVVFDVDEDDQQVVRLSRQPTPYPKDIRDRIQHFRDVAVAKGQVQGVDNTAYILAQEREAAVEAQEKVLAHNKSYTKEELEEEEKKLINLLQNKDFEAHESAKPRDERAKMQAALRKYQDECKRVSTSSAELVGSAKPSRPPDHAEGISDPAPSGNLLVVESNTGNVKLSNDSGLGSGDLAEDHHSWRNECPSIPEHENLFEVTIKKDPHLGFSVSGGTTPDDGGVFVTKVLKDGPAFGLLEPRDKIMKVNEHDFTRATHQEAVEILKSYTTVHLVIQRK